VRRGGGRSGWGGGVWGGGVGGGGRVGGGGGGGGGIIVFQSGQIVSKFSWTSAVNFHCQKLVFMVSQLYFMVKMSIKIADNINNIVCFGMP